MDCIANDPYRATIEPSRADVRLPNRSDAIGVAGGHA